MVWLTYPNLKNDGLKVSWDDEIPNSSVGMMTFPTEWKVIKIHGSSHHQPDTADGMIKTTALQRSLPKCHPNEVFLWCLLQVVDVQEYR